MPAAVINLWQEIWTYFDASDCLHKRAYSYDYERYLDDSSIEICIALISPNTLAQSELYLLIILIFYQFKPLINWLFGFLYQSAGIESPSLALLSAAFSLRVMTA